ELQAQVAALQEHNSQLEDKILELRIEKIKDFGEYLTNKK
ncbi:5482_t:CDS:1, partial [Racocetra fulgida]